MTWSVNLSNSQLNSQVSNAIADGSYSYQEVLNLLDSVAAGGVTASELNDLKTVYGNSTALFASDYVKTITYNVVYSNPANALWWGGAKTYGGVAALGDLSGATSQGNAERLIDKWFLGLDLPMPIAGGDTATGKAATGVYSYTVANGSLFANGAMAADVNQGMAGDCYYVATLGAVANAAPSVISNAFIDNGNGSYGVKFYLNGVPTYTTVNTSLPTDSGYVAFASNSNASLNGEMWVSLLEKAFVQLNTQADVADRGANWKAESSYQAIESGLASPIKLLTNLNYTYYSSFIQGAGDAYASGEFYSANPQTYKQTIINALNGGAVGWLATWGNTVDAGNGRQNFVDGHAFMLLGYNPATDKFIVRNPWGGDGSRGTASTADDFNPQFEAAITEFWNSTVQGLVAVSDAASVTPVYSYSINSMASSAGTAVTEGQAVMFTVTRSGSGTASTVFVSTTTATAGATDYQPLAKYVVSFSAYETSKTVMVSTNVDSLTEGTESFGLAVYQQASDTTSVATATAFIKDPAVNNSFSYSVASSAGSASSAVAEGSAVTFTVTRSGSGSASTVYLSTAPGSASASDYQGLSQHALNFAAYETSKTVMVNTSQDAATEGVEYFSLDLYKNIGDTSKAGSALAYVKDAYLPSYNYSITSSAASPTSAVTEGGLVSFTITRSGSGTASTVYVATAAGSAGATDYVGVSQQAITFAANEKIATLTVATNQDWWLEADEFFYLNLYKNPGDVSYASSGSAFIKDSPVTSYNYTISSSGGAGTPVTEGGAVTFTITRSGSGAASSVYLSTEAGSAGGNDFSGLNKFELSFAAYETSKTVTVNTHTDGLVEGDEYFWLDLYRNFADSSYAAYSAAYIQDMAVTTDYSYQVTSNAEDVAVTEGSVVTFTITRSGSGSASTVYWGTEAGTASAGAGDYQSLGISTLNFAAYETSKTVTVNTYADAQAEGEEYFWLNLYPTYADATNFDYAAYGFAYINDPALAVTNYDYTITSNATYAAPVSEGGSVTFTITRNGSGSAVSVYVSTSAGSAGAGDFQGLNTTELKFSAFETSKTVTVNTYTDFLTEGREYFWLDLYKSYADVGNDLWSSYGAAYLNDPAVAVTNYSYSVTSNAEDVAVTEGGVVTFTITRSGSGTASTVYWDTEDGTASAATGDYQAVGLSTLSFAANEVSKTVTVQTYSDAQTENYEYFWLNVYPTYADASNFNWADYGTAFVADPTVVATDYNYTIVSSAEDTAVTEGGTVTFTILRDGTGSASTVYVSTSDGTTDAHDFQALGLSMLTFAANEVSKTVTVKTYADTQTEYLEWFWLDLYKTYADALNDNYASYGAAYLKDFGTGAAATGLSVGKPASVAATASKVAVAGAPTAAASSAVSQSFPGHSLNEFNNDFAFAALKANGAVVAWGQSANGGDLGSVASALNGDVDVTHIYASNAAFAAVRLDGSVVSWGNASAGGDSSAVAAALNGTVDVVQVFSTATAFAALLRDGSVVSWGDPANGGDSAAVAAKLNGTTDVSTVYSNLNAFAAVRSDGSVVSWGFDLFGGNSSAVAAQLSGAIDVTQVVPTGSAFAALRADGSVVSWGSSGDGGDSSAVASQINGNIDVLALCAGSSAFAALRADGSVVSWGDVNYGGDSSAVADKLNGSNDVTALASTLSAFAALRADGSVVTWGSADGGGNSSAVASALNGTIDVTHIVANGSAFAALRADGSVVSWGYGAYGGDQSAVAGQLDGSVDVLSVAANEQAFAALRADGSVVTWGSLLAGGDSSAVKAQLDGTVDVSQLYASSAAFAALRIDGTVVTWGNLDKGGDSSGVAASLNSARNLTGDLSNAWIVSSDPTIYGTDGRDRLNSTAAAETIDGLAGIDTVVYGGNRASFTLARSGSGFTVTGASGAAGTDTLLNVERLEFADKKLAIDLEPSGHAGQAVEFLGLLVPGMVNTPSVVGLILGLFDQGQTMHEVCQLALDAGLVNSIAGSASNQALAALVFRNLTGSEADAATIDVLVSYIDGRSASFSQADFMATLAGFGINQEHIGLVGLQQTGIEYI